MQTAFEAIAHCDSRREGMQVGAAACPRDAKPKSGVIAEDSSERGGLLPRGRGGGSGRREDKGTSSAAAGGEAAASPLNHKGAREPEDDTLHPALDKESLGAMES